ncbi:hypothetical protein MGG_05423 [Pyricularia oryzae 70-15]|uniref:Uncharacterized protein n=1 Tax=Pyricularia oryzae (strain 70-15 / ATCC MYA-4617 / FGSC 8958) TaxID=242507 RepID=G4MLE1_PYRO7|nr:uncharacterized protein MGG_05423 [Pyricularia oryzae 70-15]EHA57671.1 hypothetical protein MGG_05423 [Pyricularia oryzae 70-15]
MEWPLHKTPFISPLDKSLAFAPSAKGCHCRMIRVVGDHVQRFDLNTPDDWDDASLLINDSGNGLNIIMMPPSSPSNMWWLPIRQDQWCKLVERFRLPHIFCLKNLVKQLPSITCFTCPDPSGPSQADEKLFMSMAATSASYVEVPGGWQQLAMCSTHWVSRKLTHGLFTSLDDEQMDKVEKLLQSAVSEGVAEHPCLALGISMELMLQRLMGLESNLLQRSADMQFPLRKFSPQNMTRHNYLDTKYLDWVYMVRQHSDMVLQEISATKRHLIKALERSSPSAWSGDAGLREKVVDTRFRHRFEDILMELDDLSSRVQSSLDYLMQQVTKVNSMFTQHEAMSSGMNAENGRRIAFMALLYLPISAVAAIFAMPIFKFENDWRDIYLRPVPRSKDDEVSGGMPVVSGYIWYYVVISLVLTCVTTAILLFGHRLKRRQDRRTEGVTLGAVKAGKNNSTALTIAQNLQKAKSYWSIV